MNHFESLANYYKNLHLRDRSIVAAIHLEDKEDQPFWDNQLQSISSGHYHFIPYSKSNNGKESSGCEQCLKYRSYLNQHFFICIDSDLRLLSKETNLNAESFIAQTYTYSWESHNCEASHLQVRFKEKVPDSNFNFVVFLNEFSKIVYNPLLFLIHYKVSAQTTIWNVKKFNTCIPLQPTRMELDDNGRGYLDKIRHNFETQVKLLKMPEAFTIEGLTPDNAYLHIQGHRLYDMIKHIGTLLCAGKGVAFKTEILDTAKQISGYNEIDSVQLDLHTILEKH